MNTHLFANHYPVMFVFNCRLFEERRSQAVTWRFFFQLKDTQLAIAEAAWGEGFKVQQTISLYFVTKKEMKLSSKERKLELPRWQGF